MELKPFWDFISEFDETYDFHRKRIMKEFSLSAVEVDVLMFVANNPELNTAADFIRLRKIAKSHVSLAVNTLYSKGLLEKVSDEKNKKKIHLVPTSKAEEIVKFGRIEQAEFAGVIDESVTNEEKRLLKNAMERIMKNLNEKYKDKI